MREFKQGKVPLPRSDIKFPNVDSPISLEIGCGVGMHPMQWGQENPDEHLIAIERTKEKFLKFQKRLDYHALKNILAIHDDAIHWIAHNVPEKSLSQVFILYPNPEPSNANQRFHKMPFMSFLISRLVDNGEIVLATNIESYYEEAKVLLVRDFGLKCSKVEQLSIESKPRTHFEKKYLLRGEHCFNLIFSKNIRR